MVNSHLEARGKVKFSAAPLLPGEPYLLLVLFEDVELVPELLRGLQRHRQQQQHVVHPGHHALRLVAVKPATCRVQTRRCEVLARLPGHTLVSDHVVHCEDEFPRLKVEGDGDLPRQRPANVVPQAEPGAGLPANAPKEAVKKDWQKTSASEKNF